MSDEIDAGEGLAPRAEQGEAGVADLPFAVAGAVAGAGEDPPLTPRVDATEAGSPLSPTDPVPPQAEEPDVAAAGTAEVVDDATKPDETIAPGGSTPVRNDTFGPVPAEPAPPAPLSPNGFVERPEAAKPPLDVTDTPPPSPPREAVTLIAAPDRDTSSDNGTDHAADIYGRAEDDRPIGGARAGSPGAGDANDRLHIDAVDAVVDAGAGNDGFDVQGAAGVTLDLTAASIETEVGDAGDHGLDAAAAATATDEAQTAGSADDKLHGDDSNDRLMGATANDLLSGDTGDDSLSSGGANDPVWGGDGDDGHHFIFGAGDEGEDVFDGGHGWADKVHLVGVRGDHESGDWTLTLDPGSIIENQDANSLTLSDDSSGTITFSDGETLDFRNLDTITW